MKILYDLSKEENNWTSFISDIENAINSIPNNVKYGGCALFDYLSTINKKELMSYITEELTKIRYKDYSKKILCFEIDCRNYNYNHVIAEYKIELGLYQKDCFTGTVYNTIKYYNVDDEAQSIEFNKFIEDLTDEEKACYFDYFYNEDLLTRNAENINSEIIENISEYKKEIDLDLIRNVEELKDEVKAIIRSSDSNKLIHLFKFNDTYTNEEGFGFELELFGETVRFDVEYIRKFKKK